MTNPFDLAVLDNPYDFYAAWRSEGPLCQVPDLDGAPLYLVLDYAHVAEALRRTDDLSNNLTAFFMLDPSGRRILVDPRGGGGVDVLATADDPMHAVHRQSLNRPFSERAMQAVEGELRSMVAAPIASGVASGGFDWVADVANVLPIRAIALLLGLPDADSARLKFWSDEGIEVLSGFADAARLVECTAHIEEFVGYLAEHLAQASERVREGAEPAGVIDTVASALAMGDYDEQAAFGILVQLVGAGADSTIGLTGSCALYLARDSDLQGALRHDPTLIPAFVDEVLRLETPFRGHFRHVKRACAFGGAELHEGDRLLLMWAAANRDPAAFPEPDALRLDRSRSTANKPHLGFGWGLHHCIGAPLARLEARLAVEELLARTASVSLAEPTAQPEWAPSLFLRRLSRLALCAG